MCNAFILFCPFASPRLTFVTNNFGQVGSNPTTLICMGVESVMVDFIVPRQLPLKQPQMYVSKLPPSFYTSNQLTINLYTGINCKRKFCSGRNNTETRPQQSEIVVRKTFPTKLSSHSHQIMCLGSFSQQG